MWHTYAKVTCTHETFHIYARVTCTCALGIRAHARTFLRPDSQSTWTPMWTGVDVLSFPEQGIHVHWFPQPMWVGGRPCALFPSWNESTWTPAHRTLLHMRSHMCELSCHRSECHSRAQQVRGFRCPWLPVHFTWAHICEPFSKSHSTFSTNSTSSWIQMPLIACALYASAHMWTFLKITFYILHTLKNFVDSGTLDCVHSQTSAHFSRNHTQH